MPRPLSEKIVASTGGEAEAIREHILDAALRVIQSEGLAAASTRAIASEAGIAPGTLYNYFGDRLQLVAQSILRRIHVLSLPAGELELQPGKGSIASNLHIFVKHAAIALDELVPLTASAFSDTELLSALRTEMMNADNAFNPGKYVQEYLLEERKIGRVTKETDCGAVASTIISICHDRAFQRFLIGDTRKTEAKLKEIEFIAEAITPRD